jgi:hypothetical protein
MPIALWVRFNLEYGTIMFISAGSWLMLATVLRRDYLLLGAEALLGLGLTWLYEVVTYLRKHTRIIIPIFSIPVHLLLKYICKSVTFWLLKFL